MRISREGGMAKTGLVLALTPAALLGADRPKPALANTLNRTNIQEQTIEAKPADLSHVGGFATHLAYEVLNSNYTGEHKKKVKHRHHHDKPKLLRGLGGVAGTGFSEHEVEVVKAYSDGGHFSGSHDFYVTTYGPPWNSMEGSGMTSTGISLSGDNSGEGKPRYEIAVDPNVIPYGTLVTVWPNALHWRGPFLAADTGGAIQGGHVDVYDWHNGGSSTFSASGAEVELYKGPA